MKDYTALVCDMVAAFGYETFDYNLSGKFFYRVRAHDVGSACWPWGFRHGWTVDAAPATRDALLRHGWISKCDLSLYLPGGKEFRLTDKAFAAYADLSYASREALPSRLAFKAAREEAEEDRKAHPGEKRHAVL